MKKIIISAILVYSTTLWAGFNFGECSGSETFSQHISNYDGDHENTVTVGVIPEGIQGLEIQLISAADVDIRLYGENNDKVVHWPHGILNKVSEETKPYKGVNVNYSGYYGTDGNKGHEFIKVEGTTPTNMTMKAFGYKEGDATVNYSWTGKDVCEEGNRTGHFTQDIPSKDVVVVGEIPADLNNLEISLTSDKDIDIQLYGEDGTAIIADPNGLLNGSTQASVTYNGMTIEWSGYNGTNGHKGHEYIKIVGKTTEKLTMKAYGYEAGPAEVDYSWGNTVVDIGVYSISNSVVHFGGMTETHRVIMSGIANTARTYLYTNEPDSHIIPGEENNGFNHYNPTPIFPNEDIIFDSTNSTIIVPAGINSFDINIKTFPNDIANGSYGTYNITLDGVTAFGMINMGE